MKELFDFPKHFYTSSTITVFKVLETKASAHRRDSPGELNGSYFSKLWVFIVCQVVGFLLDPNTRTLGRVLIKNRGRFGQYFPVQSANKKNLLYPAQRKLKQRKIKTKIVKGKDRFGQVLYTLMTRWERI